jgi:hypothetical protein
MSGCNPVAQAATAVRPVYGVASDSARQRTFQPDSEVGAEALFELRRYPREEQPDVVGRPRSVHPGEPLPQVFAVPVHQREQYFGVFPLELSEFDAIGYPAPKHFRSSGHLLSLAKYGDRCRRHVGAGCQPAGPGGYPW